MLFYAQLIAKGYIREKQNVFLPQVNISDSLLSTYSTVEDKRTLEKMKLNEPGRQKLDRYRSSVSRHSIHSYILTQYRIRTRNTLIALSSHQGDL